MSPSNTEFNTRVQTSEEKIEELKKLLRQANERMSKDRVALDEAYKKSRKKSSIPPLKATNVARFIMAIPRAVATGELTAAQGNHLLYAAQTLISYMRVTGQNATPPPTPLGFAVGTKGKK